jgi:antirestriction protein ArdC
VCLNKRTRVPAIYSTSRIRPWHRPWNAEHAAGRITRPLRHNGIPYKGINVVMLWSAAVNGYFEND